MSQNIEHPGIIEKIENGRIWVSIQPQSACGSCHSKSYCNMSEVTDKMVEISNDIPAHSYKIGQSVTINLRKSLGYRALMLGYLLPFLLLLSTLITSLMLTSNEGLSAILSIAVIIPYYGLLYAMREKIKSGFRFHIRS